MPSERFGIDVLQPDEHRVAARARRLLDEAGDAVAQRVDLQQQADLEALVLAQLDEPVEDRLPVLVAREIVVGDEEFGDALRGVGAHDLLDVVRRAVARLAALHVDDGAERALERAAAPGIEAGIVPVDARHDARREDRQRGGRHFGHVGEIIVGRLRGAGGDIAQQAGHAALALAGEQRDAEIERLLQVGRQLRQHRDAAGDMEPADDHRHVGRAELAREIERARILVRLHADQADEARAGGADLSDRALDVDDGVALVIGVDLDIDVGAEHLRLGALGQQAVDAREAVRRDRGAPPLDDVAVGVVMRRLDQDDLEDLPSHCAPDSPTDVTHKADKDAFDKHSHTNATGLAFRGTLLHAHCPQMVTVRSNRIHNQRTSRGHLTDAKNNEEVLMGTVVIRCPATRQHHTHGHHGGPLEIRLFARILCRRVLSRVRYIAPLVRTRSVGRGTAFRGRRGGLRWAQ